MQKSQSQSVKLLVDDREDAKVVQELLILGVDCEVVRLKTGDYVSGDVCIERKTIDDLCSSIVDGRIKTQCRRISARFKHGFVLVSGKISERTADIHEHCILGMIASLVIKYGVNVIIVDDDKQLAYLISRILTKLQEVKQR